MQYPATSTNACHFISIHSSLVTVQTPMSFSKFQKRDTRQKSWPAFETLLSGQSSVPERFCFLSFKFLINGDCLFSEIYLFTVSKLFGNVYSKSPLSSRRYAPHPSVLLLHSQCQISLIVIRIGIKLVSNFGSSDYTHAGHPVKLVIIVYQRHSITVFQIGIENLKTRNHRDSGKRMLLAPFQVYIGDCLRLKL